MVINTKKNGRRSILIKEAIKSEQNGKTSVTMTLTNVCSIDIIIMGVEPGATDSG